MSSKDSKSIRGLIENELRIAIKTGKVVLGSKQTIKLVKIGKAKLVVIASNAPPQIKKDVKYYASLSGTPIYEYEGTNMELGAICGKPFSVAALAIIDPGESNILSLLEEQRREG